MSQYQALKRSESPLVIRKPYDKPVRVSLNSFETTLAQQQFAEECDINTIMDRYAQDGLLDHVNNFQGSYGDFTSVTDYQTSVNQVIAAEAAFMDLPAAVRSRFGNDPGQLIGFLESNDPELLAESYRLGLREAPPETEAPPAPKPKKAASGGVQEPPDGGDQSPKG